LGTLDEKEWIPACAGMTIEMINDELIIDSLLRLPRRFAPRNDIFNRFLDCARNDGQRDWLAMTASRRNDNKQA